MEGTSQLPCSSASRSSDPKLQFLPSITSGILSLSDLQRAAGMLADLCMSETSSLQMRVTHMAKGRNISKCEVSRFAVSWHKEFHFGPSSETRKCTWLNPRLGSASLSTEPLEGGHTCLARPEKKIGARTGAGQSLLPEP